MEYENTLLTYCFFLPQPRRPQVDCARPDHHQRKPALAAAPLLRRQEVPASRPPPQADPRHPPPIKPRGCRPRHREAEEEAETFPSAELRRQGALRVNIIHVTEGKVANNDDESGRRINHALTDFDDTRNGHQFIEATRTPCLKKQRDGSIFTAKNGIFPGNG
jgi:hypothetical protein